MLSYINFFKGICTSVDFFFGVILGIIFYMKARKLRAKLLSLMSLQIIFAGFIYSVMSYDFLIVVFTDKNIANPYGLVGILTWIWAPFIGFIATYVATELLFPEKFFLKRLMQLMVLIIGLIFGYFILIDPQNSFNFNKPPIAGEDIYDPDLIYGSSAFFAASIFMLLVVFFCGSGYLFRSIKSEDILKRKFLYLALTSFLYGGAGMVDGTGILINIAIIPRFLTLLSFWFWYLSLKEEEIKPSEISVIEEIEVEKSIFIVFKRPEHIDEEEVTFHRERKICLVCNKKVEGINFICSTCDTVYCEQCASSLMKLENVCWVCNSPIDLSKPVKPFKIKGSKTKLLKKKKKYIKSHI